MRTELNRQARIAILLLAPALFVIVPSLAISQNKASGVMERASQAKRQTFGTELVNLLSHKQYLELENLLRTSSDVPVSELTFVEGVLANSENRIANSIRLLKPLLSASATKLTREEEILGLRALADDYMKSFRYADAASTYAKLLHEFGASLSRSESSDIDGNRQMAILLRRAPPETVALSSAFTISTRRDAIGGIEAPITVAGHTEPWILDTGAGMSLVTRSRAEQLGLVLSKGTTPVAIYGGATANAHVAVIPALRIGGAVVRNVVTLVVEDKDYYVPPVHFQMEALLGHTVLAALGQTTFFRDGRIRVAPFGEASNTSGAEMFMDGFTVLVAAGTPKQLQLFTLDTGTGNTILTERYFREFRRDFAAQKLTGVEVFGHPGRVPCYEASSATLTFGNVPAKLQHVFVVTQPIGNGWDSFYGNLGQDVLKQFRSYILDFHLMRLTVTP